jgi:hypothetical protein
MYVPFHVYLAGETLNLVGHRIDPDTPFEETVRALPLEAE